MESEKVMTFLERNPKKSVAKVAGALESNSCKKKESGAVPNSFNVSIAEVCYFTITF